MAYLAAAFLLALCVSLVAAHSKHVSLVAAHSKHVSAEKYKARQGHGYLSKKLDVFRPQKHSSKKHRRRWGKRGGRGRKRRHRKGKRRHGGRKRRHCRGKCQYRTGKHRYRSGKRSNRWGKRKQHLGRRRRHRRFRHRPRRGPFGYRKRRHGRYRYYLARHGRPWGHGYSPHFQGPGRARGRFYHSLLRRRAIHRLRRLHRRHIEYGRRWNYFRNGRPYTPRQRGYYFRPHRSSGYRGPRHLGHGRRFGPGYGRSRGRRGVGHGYGFTPYSGYRVRRTPPFYATGPSFFFPGSDQWK